jgi:hypothetical protein
MRLGSSRSGAHPNLSAGSGSAHSLLPRVIRPRAGIAEGAEPFVGADQFLDLGARVGVDQAEGYFTDDFVTLIAPRQASGHTPPDTSNKTTSSRRFI